MGDEIDEITIDFDEVDDVSLQVIGDEDQKYTEKKITLPVMSVYEKVNIISARMKQLNSGFRSTIEDILKEENIVRSYDIAMKEFELGKLPPYHVKRILPNGNYELWRHEDFSIYPD